MILGLLLWFSASLGIQDYTEGNTDFYVYPHPPIYAELEIHAENDWLDIYGIYQNEMEMDTLVSYKPLNDYFTLGAKLNLDSHFSLNIEHMCQHPVGNWKQSLDGEYGGYNKIWIEVTSK